MIKIYFILLGIFAAFVFLINICSFAAGFDSKQIINILHLKERSAACAYLIKNIVFETGINIKKTDEDVFNKIVEDAASLYEINIDTLKSLVNREKEFSISQCGGMGAASIKPKYFLQTSFKDPFITEENIKAAAELIKMLTEKGEEEKIKECFSDI